MPGKRIAVALALFFTFFEINVHADSYFEMRSNELARMQHIGNNSIVFVGDGITYKNEWWEAFGGNPDIKSFCATRAKSDDILKHIGPLVEGHPAKVFLMVGIRDLADNVPEEVVEKNIKAIIEQFHKRSPKTKLYIQSILPVRRPSGTYDYTIIGLNNRLSLLCKESQNATYVDLWSLMHERGSDKLDIKYSTDGTNLNVAGFSVWCHAIEDLVGSKCIYPLKPESQYIEEEVPGVNLRGTTYPYLELKKDDAVFFGGQLLLLDWHSMLGDTRLKNRASGWSYGTISLKYLIDDADRAFKGQTNPHQIWVYAGEYEASLGEGINMEEFNERYMSLALKLKNLCPASEIILMGLVPSSDELEDISFIPEINNRIKYIAVQTGCSYFDSFGALIKDGKVNQDYYLSKHLSANGYANLFDAIVPRLDMSGPTVLAQVKSGYGHSFIGRGENNESLMDVIISSQPSSIRRLDIRLEDKERVISKLHIEMNGQVLKTVKTHRGKSLYRIRKRIETGSFTKINVTADVIQEAAEGSKIKVSLAGIKGEFAKNYILHLVEPAVCEVVRAHKTLFQRWMNGASVWKNPTLTTLPDGTLMATADKRKYSVSDLPADIDICARFSSDGGQSWSEPSTVIKSGGAGKSYAAPAVFVAENGDVVMMACGGPGLKEKKDRSKICTVRSEDCGKTWSEPLEIQDNIYPILDTSAHYMSVSSGHGTVLRHGPHKGRMIEALNVFAGKYRIKINAFKNYILYSDDNGQSWDISPEVWSSLGEIKFAELEDGTVLGSTKAGGKRGQFHSEDGGETWTGKGLWASMNSMADNGDFIDYTTPDGRKVLLHSLPDSDHHEDLTIFEIDDNSGDWKKLRCVWPGLAPVSALCALPDGTIGVLTESGTDNQLTMEYVNVSYEWLCGEK